MILEVAQVPAFDALIQPLELWLACWVWTQATVARPLVCLGPVKQVPEKLEKQSSGLEWPGAGSWRPLKAEVIQERSPPQLR